MNCKVDFIPYSLWFVLVRARAEAVPSRIDIARVIMNVVFLCGKL